MALAAVALTGDQLSHAKGWPTPAAGPSLSGDPEIIFTFDDGPSPTTTPKVLDTLAKYKVKAIFFLVGEMAGSENKKIAPIVKRILDEGHVIANHTFEHKDLCRGKTSDEAAAKDIDHGKATIEKVAGVNTFWFRAPYGVRCDRLDGMLAERHIQHFHWDLDPQEWKHGDKQKTVDYVTGEMARARGRNVLLMHDIKPVTVQALPEILAWLDAENARRKESGKKPIHIVQAPDLARESLSPGLEGWARETLGKIGDVRKDLARVLP